MKSLVAYFSASGTTERVAKLLGEAANADVFCIEPVKPYSPSDLDWTNSKSRSSIEMSDKNSRPEIAKKVANMAQYDVVFVGFPIWWYVAPTIVNTFLESYDFSGKTIVPFATSGSSGLGKTEEFLHASCPNATWQAGKMLNGRQTKESLSSWVKTLGL